MRIRQRMDLTPGSFAKPPQPPLFGAASLTGEPTEARSEHSFRLQEVRWHAGHIPIKSRNLSNVCSYTYAANQGYTLLT
jgi:hypothetical protein